MWLRIRKQLSTETGKRIRANCKKTEFLSQLKDGNFLWEASLAKKIVWEKASAGIKILVYTNVGPIKTAAYGLTINKGAEEYSKVFRDCQSAAKNNFRIILLRNGVGAATTNISINIASPDVDNNEFDFAPSENSEANIFSLATYFYNKFEVYKRTYEVLLAEKIKLCENLGKAYTDALIALFSVEKASEAAKTYALPLKNIALKTKNNKTGSQVEELFTDTIEIEATRLQLGNAGEFLFVGSSEKSRIYLSLDEANILYLECPIAFISAEKINKLTSFIRDQLEAWLKAFEERANFGLSICEKVKTKILVDNM